MTAKRERVIIDVKNLDDAVKVEQTIKTGYCDTIEDNLNVWIAVEEDLMDSYARLPKKAGSRFQQTLDGLDEESKENLKTLRALLKSVGDLSRQRESRVKKIMDLKSSAA